jgi:hypothetical protein
MSYTEPLESTTRAASAAVARPEIARNVAAGVIAGQIAGLIMAIAAMTIFTIFLGKGPFHPAQVVGSLIFGDWALGGFHLPAFLAGVVLHQFGPSLVWGVGFGLVTYFLDIRRGSRLVGLAVATGILSQIVDVNLILPFAFHALHGHDIWAGQVPAFWSWVSHVVFGLGLATFPVVYDYLGVLSSRSPARTT